MSHLKQSHDNITDNTSISSFDFSDLFEQLSCVKMDSEVDGVLKDLKDMIDKKNLEQHHYTIYYSETEQNWITYVPDETRKGNRRRVKRKSKEHLENYLIEFYREKQKKESYYNITLEDLYKKWLIFKRDETATKGKTIYEYTIDWKKFCENTLLVKMRVKDITSNMLVKFFRSITKDESYTYKRISNVRSLLNGILYYAVEEGIIPHNPLLDVNFKSFTYKPVDEQVDNVYSQEDTFKLLTYLADINEPYSLAIQLSFYLFIRVGETKAIKIEDINLEAKTIRLHLQAVTERILNDDLTFSARRVNVINQMKGKRKQGFRTQVLTDEAIVIVKKALALNPHGTFLFEPNGKLMLTDTFNEYLKKYCIACGVPYYSSHKIRFYNASTSYDGTNLATISKLMGHSKTATTLNYLRNVNRENEIENTINKLGLTAQRS